MLINDGPAPQGYYDEAGRWHFYDPERAISEGRLLLRGLGCGGGCGCRQCQGVTGLGAVVQNGGVVLTGVALALLVGWGVWMVAKPAKRR
jgi:hypothetical protein